MAEKAAEKVLDKFFPPIVPTYGQTAIIKDYNDFQETKIYFGISKYQGVDDYSNIVQASFRNYNTGLSLLNSERYPTGTGLFQMQLDEDKKDDYPYYIEISSSDLNINLGEIEDSYSALAQIRLINKELQDQLEELEDNYFQKLDSLTGKEELFSEWSSISIITFAKDINFVIEEFLDGDIEQSHRDWDLSTNVSLGIKNTNEINNINAYRIVASLNSRTIEDTGIIYKDLYDNGSVIYKTLKTNFEQGTEYSLSVTCYNIDLDIEKTKLYTITVLNSFQEKLGLQIKEMIEDEENGRIGIRICGDAQSEDYTGQIVVRRASAKDNFEIWEDLETFSFSTGLKNLNWIYWDFTVESGIYYKYQFSKKNSMGLKGEPIESTLAMVTFDNMFLTTHTQQLKIKFNPNVSSFRKVVSESKTTTIGGKYPYIRRNADTFYTEMPISGLISFEMDEDLLLISEEKNHDIYERLFDSSKDFGSLYSEYNYYNFVANDRDYNKERFFREIVMKFLYTQTPKLFRSPTEGNYLVRITDVSLTPDAVTGRYLYNFSATATEIDDDTVDNYKKYKILPLDKDCSIDPAIRGARENIGISSLSRSR